jgi:threonine/homoserine/homoserine lactone efflux protein
MNIDLHGLLLFTIASFVLVIMPGPNTLYVITRGVTQGKRAALISAFGAPRAAFICSIYCIRIGCYPAAVGNCI